MKKRRKQKSSAKRIKIVRGKTIKKPLSGLFFGSFNPVHLGHTHLAQYIYENYKLDELTYIVTPRNPLKTDDELLDEQIRYKMLELATAETPYLNVSDVEFSMPKPSYTIDTLRKLAAQSPEKSFVLLIGSDNMQIFDKWHEYRAILDEFAVWVYPRKGYDYKPYMARFPKMKILTDAPLFDISSTEIRDMIQKEQDASEWLHPAVYQFIRENNLYK